MTNVTTNKPTKSRQLYWDITFAGWILFLLFRIPITNIIGNEGNGYYVISFEIYTFISVFFGYCLHQATRDVMKTGLKKYNHRTRGTLFTLLVFFSVIVSALGAIILFFVSKYMLNFLHFELSGISLRVFCFLLILISVSGVLRGYFEGYGTKVPTAFSRIIEAFVAGSGGIFFSSILSKHGAKVGALLYNKQYTPAFSSAGLALGSLCGGFLSLFFLFFVYQIYQRTQTKSPKVALEKEKSNISLIKEIIKVSFFVFLNYVCFHLYRLTNLALYITNISKQIQEEKESINVLSLVGSYHGKIMVLVGILALTVLSFSGKSINKISHLYRKKRFNNCYECLVEDMKQILVLSIPFTLLFAVLSQNILTLFYKTSNLTEINLLKIASLNIIFIPLAIYFYCILRRINLNISLFIIPVIAFIGQTLVMYFLVNTEGIRLLSIAIAEVIFWFFLLFMELIVLMKEFKQILNK